VDKRVVSVLFFSFHGQSWHSRAGRLERVKHCMALVEPLRRFGLSMAFLGVRMEFEKSPVIMLLELYLYC
jgi:hypothetical protein